MIGNDGEFGVFFNVVIGVYQLIVNVVSQCGFGQVGVNIGGDVMNGYGFGKIVMVVIW